MGNFCEQSRIYGKYIKDAGGGDRVRNKMGNFCEQSHIYGKYIKDAGCGDRLKNKMGIFCEQSHIYGKYIKDAGCGDRRPKRIVRTSAKSGGPLFSFQMSFLRKNTRS